MRKSVSPGSHEDVSNMMERGHTHTFAHEISMYQIWSFYRVSYLREFDNFTFNLEHYFTS